MSISIEDHDMAMSSWSPRHFVSRKRQRETTGNYMHHHACNSWELHASLSV